MRRSLAMRMPRWDGLLLAIALAVLIGLACIAFGVWAMVHPPPEWLPRKLAIMPVVVGVAGVVVTAQALLEVGQRLRRRASVPGSPHPTG